MTTKNILSIIGLSLLGLCLFLGLAKMATKNKKKHEECNKICNILVFISIILFAVVQLLQETNSGFHVKGEPSSSGHKLTSISADSWCSYSKKISAEEKEISNALKKLGVDFELVSDSKDKSKFDELAKKYKKDVKGYPHNVLIKNGNVVAHMPGYNPADKLAEAVKKHM